MRDYEKDIATFKDVLIKHAKTRLADHCWCGWIGGQKNDGFWTHTDHVAATLALAVRND